jgi:non-ribosomal peptide synthetase component F
MEQDRRLIFSLEYNTRLFKKETISRFIGYFKNIVKAITVNPGIKIGEIEIPGKQEKEKILELVNGIHETIDLNATIHEKFERIVSENPDGTALVFEEQRLSYGELNRAANRLALVLRSKGIRPNKIVGLMVERSLEMIIGIMAILKAGGACLPVDPHYPQERKRFMLENSTIPLLLINFAIHNREEYIPRDIQVMDISRDEFYSGGGDNLHYFSHRQTQSTSPGA